jgi:3-oxocholest-4-en-26-oate---CoA ligase
MEHNWATVWEHIADAAPGAPAVVDGTRRRSWAQFDERAARVAGLLHEAGVGPGARVALYLYNSAEYLEAYAGILKARAVPVNVNYRYVDDELAYLLNDSGAEVLVHHTILGYRVARAVRRAPSVRLLVAVDDGPDGTADTVIDDTDTTTDTTAEMTAEMTAGPGRRPGPRAVAYEEALAAVTPAPRQRRSGDDTTVLYTGGTTGIPKGVVTRIGPHVESIIAAVAPMLGVDPSVDIDEIPAIAARTIAAGAQIVSLPACPLMHGTGMGLGVIPPMAYGGCVVLLTGRRFDPDELWSTVESERVTWTVIVGDPFARPMLQRLRASVESGQTYDTSSLRVIGSSGAMFSAEVRGGLLELLPRILILDYISSSEGQMGVAISHAADVVPTARFTPSAGVKVFTEDDREVAPGSGERGIVALSVGVPEGYFQDEAKSAATFRTVDGVRYSFPGDWATVDSDGSISLLGRGSQCINTGGEKVFPQEVEEAVKCHPAVEDCLVFGLPDERFGQRVTAIVSLVDGAEPTVADIIADTGRRLSAFKLPKAITVVPVVPRAANGKADYQAARALAAPGP